MRPLVLFALVMGAAPWLAAWAGQPQLGDILRVLAFPLLIMGFGTIGRALLQRALDFKRISIVELSSAVLSAVVAFGGALAGVGVWALVAGLMAYHVLNTSLFLLWSPERTRPRFDLLKLLPQLRFGSMIFSASIASTGAGMLPAFAVGRVFGPYSAGLWALANDLADIIAGRVIPIVTAVAFPAIAEVQSQTERLRDYFSRGSALLAFVVFPILFGLAATSPEIVPLILGPQWVGAVLICSFLCIRGAFWAVSAVLNSLIVGQGRPDLVMRNSFWRLGLTMIAVFVALPASVETFAVSLLAVEFIMLSLNFRVAIQMLRVTVRRMIAPFMPPVLNAMIMAAVVWQIGGWAPEEWNILVTLAVKIVAGMILYGALAAIADRPNLMLMTGICERFAKATAGRVIAAGMQR